MRIVAWPSAFCVACAVLVGCTGATGPVDTGPTPAATITIDKISTYPGYTIRVPVVIQYSDSGKGIDSISGFRFLVGYDPKALSPVGASQGPGIWGWEYFRWGLAMREGPRCEDCPALITVWSVRDLDNGRPPYMAQGLPAGTLFTFIFSVRADTVLENTTTEIGFDIEYCLGNTLTPAGRRDTSFVPFAVESRTGTQPGPDTADCGQGLALKPVLLLRTGAVHISPAKDAQPVGDIDLNGVPFENADAALFADYFIYGYNVLSTDPIKRALQIAQTDINRDGIPLTVADWDRMVRFVYGSMQPADSLFVVSRDTASIEISEDSANTMISVISRSPVTALWLAAQLDVPGSVTPVWIDPSNHTLPEIRYGQGPSGVRILVTSWRAEGRLNSLGGQYLSIPKPATIRVTDAQASKYHGIAMAVRIVTKGGSPQL